LIFFHLVCIGWLIFRAGALHSHKDQLILIKDYLLALLRLPAGAPAMASGVLLLCAAGLWFQWKNEAMESFNEWPLRKQTLGVVLIVTAILALGVFQGAQFIYFQF